MNIWIPLALIAGSLTTPALANQAGATDEAIIAAKKEVAEAQAHLEQLLDAREATQFMWTASGSAEAPELTWKVVSSASGDGDGDSCSAHKPAMKGHANMDSCGSMGAGPHEMTIEINTAEMDCSFGDMPMGNKRGHGMQRGHRGKGHGGMGAGHGVMGMPMNGGNENTCGCNADMGGARGPHRGMMEHGMGHGKAPRGMQRMMSMFGGQPEEQCPHAPKGPKGHGGQRDHGQAPHGSMRGMLFMDGQDSSGHGDQGWKNLGQDNCGNGWADQDDDNQGRNQAWWFDEDSDDAHSGWNAQGMVFGKGEQQFEWLSGEDSQCDFGNESSEEAECDSWRDSDDCAQGQDENAPNEYTFEIVEGKPNWVTGTAMIVEDSYTDEDSFDGDIDAEIEVLLRRLESDGTEARVIRISSDRDYEPMQLQATIEVETEDNACTADADSDIDALIREIECSIEGDVAQVTIEEPVMKDAEVQVRVVDESASRIEQLEGEVAELRDLVESLVKELNKN